MISEYQAGKYKVYPVKTGEFAMDGGAVFGIIPKVFWEKHTHADIKNRVKMAVRSLLLVSNKRKILIDTGIGNKIDDKVKNIYQIDMKIHNLTNGLAATSIRPEEITDVILTHLHFDHSGGAVDILNGQLKPAFPNAIYHVGQEQWKWAQNPLPIDKTSFKPENYSILKDLNKLSFLEPDKENFPGIRIFEINGHTPGQVMVMIDDDQEPILFCSDLMPTSLHVPVTWISAYDLNSVAVVAEKEAFLENAAENRWRVFFPHDSNIIAANIVKGPRHFHIRNPHYES